MNYYIPVSKESFKLIIESGVTYRTPPTSYPGTDYEWFLFMGCITFMVQDNKLYGTDGDPLKFRWLIDPVEAYIEDGILKFKKEELWN